MATTKLILRTDKARQDGTAPIYLRITEHRKSRYVTTRVHIAGKDWNEDKQEVRKSNPDHVVLNDELTRLKSEAQTTAIKIRQRVRGKGSAAAVKQELLGKSGGSILDYAETYADRQFKTDHYWDARNVRVVIKKLCKFVGSDDLSFSEIDRVFLGRFEAHLKAKYDNSQNTRAKNLQIIRRIIRHAVQDGLMAPADDPFLHYSISTVSAQKEKLPFDQIQDLDGLDLSSEPSLALARDSFLFSFYLAGIRFGDLCALRWKNEKDGRLVYTMMKTKTQKAIKLSPPALIILEKYRPPSDLPEGFIFPILRMDRDYSDTNFLRRRISSKNVVINRDLKILAERIGTNVNVSFHIARHSFADYARSSGQPLYAISKALGHSKLQTTQIYLAAFDLDAEDALMDGLFG